MKSITQNFVPLLVLLSLLFTASITFAQEETETSTEEETASQETENEEGPATTRRAELKEKAENLRDKAVERKASSTERRAEFQEKSAERKAELSDRIQERIINLAANLSNRLDAAAERMQNIIDRIDSRITKLNDRGVDTDAAERALADAQAAVDAALAGLAEIDRIVTDAITSNDPRTVWKTAKSAFLEIKENIKSAHSALRTTVEELKKAVAGAQSDNGVSDAVRNADVEETPVISE